MAPGGDIVKRLSIVGVLVGTIAMVHAIRAAPPEEMGQASGSPVVAGGRGPPTLVLLHGYGCSAAAWQPFTRTIDLTPNGRFIFPQAPLTMSPDGPDTKRAWWRFNLQSYIPKGDVLPDLSHAQPAGIQTAAATIRKILRGVERPGKRPVLGGFSQGAMVASEVAFASNEPLAALVLLSGTVVDDARWAEGLPRRRGLPVFIAHGRSDPTLSFAIAARFASTLEAAGMDVTWVPFDGGHEIPALVVVALNHFLARVSQEQFATESYAAHATAMR